MRSRVVAALVVVLGLGALGGCEKPSVESYGSQFDAWAANDGALEALRLTEPDFYDGLRTTAAEDLRNGKSRTKILEEAEAALRDHSLALGVDLAHAPDAALMLSFEADRDLISQLQMKDVGLCADFAMGRAPREVVRREELEYLYQRTAVARMTGALEGRDSPVERSGATDADYVAVYREMMRWSVPEALARQLIEKGLEGRTEDEQCDTAVAYYEAVLAQPTARAARLIADLQKAMAETGGEV